MSRAPTTVVTNSIMSDQPRAPTLLDDGSIKTRSITFVLQSDSALRQTYIFTVF